NDGHEQNLEQIKHEDLPYIREEEARTLLDDLVDLLEGGFGYKRAAGRPRRDGNGKLDGGGGRGERDWTHLYENILEGRELHDSLVVLAAKLIAGGTNSGATVNLLRGLMENSKAAKDDRWRARVLEIPAAVDSAVAKYGSRQTTARSSSGPAVSPSAGDAPATDAIIVVLAVVESADSASITGETEPKPQPYAIEQTIIVFKSWLVLSSTTPVYAMLGTIAANILPGDPVWLGLIAPPSSAKTE